MTDGSEELLAGGSGSDVRRVGGVVLRAAKPQSRTVMALLHHLQHAGFEAAPRPVGDGFGADGQEKLIFIEGVSPQPYAWSDDAVWRIGRLLRRLHDATASFAEPSEAVWAPWFARSLPGRRPAIGHCDLGPWNILARDGTPVAFIDWENAGPIDALWELAHAAWLNAQLHDDDVAALNQLPSPDDRARQLSLIVEGYGLDHEDRAGFVDKMIELAIRSARQEAIDYQIARDTPSPVADGFPVLWSITWRTRGAAWMIEHRALLESALEVRMVNSRRMEPADNAEVIGRLHRALFVSGDLDAVVDEFFAPSFASHNTPPGLPSGIDGVKVFFAMFRDGLSDIEVTVDHIVSQNDSVAVATTTSGTHTGQLFGVTPTGRRVSVTGIDIVRLAEGKIIEHRGLTDTVGLLRQLSGQ